MAFFGRKGQDGVYRYTWPKDKILGTVKQHFRTEVISDREIPEGREYGVTFVKVHLDDNIFFLLTLLGASPNQRDDISEMHFSMNFGEFVIPARAFAELNQKLHISSVSLNEHNHLMLSAELIFPEKYAERLMQGLLGAWISDLRTTIQLVLHYNARSIALRQVGERVFAGRTMDLTAVKPSGFATIKRSIPRQVMRYRAF